MIGYCWNCNCFISLSYWKHKGMKWWQHWNLQQQCGSINFKYHFGSFVLCWYYSIWHLALSECSTSPLTFFATILSRLFHSHSFSLFLKLKCEMICLCERKQIAFIIEININWIVWIGFRYNLFVDFNCKCIVFLYCWRNCDSTSQEIQKNDIFWIGCTKESVEESTRYFLCSSIFHFFNRFTILLFVFFFVLCVLMSSFCLSLSLCWILCAHHRQHILFFTPELETLFSWFQ
jgi:hypothetical protein